MDLNKNKPVEKDEVTGDRLLTGHEYDDIHELDNNLPKWWTWLFIITIVFSVVYVIIYDLMRVAPYQGEEYKTEMAMVTSSSAEQASRPGIGDTIPRTDRASLDAGLTIWEKQCKVCHLAGQGLVGPNLTDAFSIHGCNYTDIVKIITDGAPEKGMISWKTQLSEQQISEVASYVMTLKDLADLPNPKAPQGDPCK